MWTLRRPSRVKRDFANQELIVRRDSFRAEHCSLTTEHSDSILGGFLRRSEMSTRLRTWMVVSLAGAALACEQAAVAQHEPDYRTLDRELTRAWQFVPSWLFMN